eukprot:5861211-Pleurochrysis_carterae.AAC.2
MPVRRRRLVGAMCADPLCAYDALRAAWLAQEAEVPAEQRRPGSKTPFFTGESGRAPWSTATSRRVAKNMEAAAGEDPTSFGGTCWRSGGATDLRDRLGDANKATIKQRGRGSSDAALVYQRALLDHQL